ncbi:MAG: hypothetical protein OSA99_02360 [Acidimicrobiales bacterium]|nr:hypothetical protein [Acidimicrobiales bacterium]
MMTRPTSLDGAFSGFESDRTPAHVAADASFDHLSSPSIRH